MFPEKENIQQNGNDPGENDNKKLEHDPEAKDPYGQEKQNEAAYELANNQMEADPESARNIFSDPSFIYPNEKGKVVDYTFPEGLTITSKIVGGCKKDKC